MAYEQNIESISVEASGALTQYTVVVINSSGQLANSTAAGKIDGVIQETGVSGQAAQVAVEGITKVVAGAAVTAGDDLTPGTSGKVVTATTGDVVCGRAMEDASGDGSVFPMLLNPQLEPLS